MFNNLTPISMKKVFISLILSVLWSSIFGQIVSEKYYDFGQTISNTLVTIKNPDNTYTTRMDCDAYSTRQTEEKTWVQTHGLPPQSSTYSSDLPLSVSGKWGKGIMMEYQFVKGNIYKFSLTGKKSGKGGALVLSLAKGLLESANVYCSEYELQPSASKSQNIFNSDVNWNGSSVLILNGLNKEFIADDNYTQFLDLF
jgi:hypothetical protein